MFTQQTEHCKQVCAKTLLAMLSKPPSVPIYIRVFFAFFVVTKLKTSFLLSLFWRWSGLLPQFLKTFSFFFFFKLSWRLDFGKHFRSLSTSGILKTRTRKITKDEERGCRILTSGSICCCTTFTNWKKMTGFWNTYISGIQKHIYV